MQPGSYEWHMARAEKYRRQMNMWFLAAIVWGVVITPAVYLALVTWV